MVPEDTIATNVYMSSYLRHRKLQYGAQSSHQHSRMDIANQ